MAIGTLDKELRAKFDHLISFTSQCLLIRKYTFLYHCFQEDELTLLASPSKLYTDLYTQGHN